MAARVLKWKWPTATEQELYAGQHVWKYPEQDTNKAYLCEMRSGPRAGYFYWFKESEFLPLPESNTALLSESESS